MKNTATLYIDSNYLSPYALFVYATLVEKKIPFQLKRINLQSREQHRPEFERLSLTAKIPTLVHDDFSLAESSAIIEYLEEVFPFPAHPSVFPETIKQRARVRQLQAWIRSDLPALREERPTTVIFQTPRAAPLSEQAQADSEKLLRVANTLITDPKAGIFGPWCIGDTELALTLNRLVANGDAVPEKIRQYVDAQWKRPAIQTWIAHQAPSPSF